MLTGLSLLWLSSIHLCLVLDKSRKLKALIRSLSCFTSEIYAAQVNNYSGNIVYDQPLGLARMNLLMPLKIIFSHTVTVRAQWVPDANGFVLLLKSFLHRGHFLIRTLSLSGLPRAAGWYWQSYQLGTRRRRRRRNRRRRRRWRRRSRPTSLGGLEAREIRGCPTLSPPLLLPLFLLSHLKYFLRELLSRTLKKCASFTAHCTQAGSLDRTGWLTADCEAGVNCREVWIWSAAHLSLPWCQQSCQSF